MNIKWIFIIISFCIILYLYSNANINANIKEGYGTPDNIDALYTNMAKVNITLKQYIIYILVDLAASAALFQFTPLSTTRKIVINEKMMTNAGSYYVIIIYLLVSNEDIQKIMKDNTLSPEKVNLLKKHFIYILLNLELYLPNVNNTVDPLLKPMLSPQLNTLIINISTKITQFNNNKNINELDINTINIEKYDDLITGLNKEFSDFIAIAP